MVDWSWPGSVISRVIDGDTVEATLTNPNVGFGSVVSFPVRLRLNRINADPVKTGKGLRCRARVLALTAGARVTIITGKGYKYGAPDGKTGEWMAEVLLPDGSNLSDVLVAEGLAVHWDGAGRPAARRRAVLLTRPPRIPWRPAGRAGPHPPTPEGSA